MSWTGDPTAGRSRLRLAVAAMTLAPALLVAAAVPGSVAHAASPGVEVTVTVDGDPALAPASASVDADGVLDVTVAIGNDLGGPVLVAVDAGPGVSCAETLVSGPTFDCAGQQFPPGQLGPTTRTATVTTRADWDALALGNVAQVTFGEHHGCALDASGYAWCWGANTDGRLGIGSTATPQRAAVAVAGDVVAGAPQPPHQFQQISAGQQHTCALDPAGQAWCWGAGADGQLGQGAYAGSTTPVRVATVAGAQPFASISSADSHTCALSQAGTVWCWGDGSNGRTGWGSTNDANTPMRAGSNRTYRAVSAGGGATCAIVATDTTASPAVPGNALCWGLGYALTPGSSKLAGDWAAVDLGANHGCLLATADGAAACWGANASGQLGNGTTSTSAGPTAVSTAAAPSAYASISAGDRYTCGVTAGDELWCWGEFDNQRLGGPSADQTAPQQVTGTYRQVATTGSAAASGGTTCTLTAASRVRCWGYAGGGETGGGAAAWGTTTTAAPVALAATHVESFAYVIDVSGTIDASVTTAVDGQPADALPGPWAQSGRPITKTYTVTNDDATTALTGIGVDDPAGVCPGGALGPGESLVCTATATMSALPAAYASSVTATVRPAIAAASLDVDGVHSCVTTVAEVAWCWGANTNRQLGTGGATTPSATPLHVGAFTAFTAVDVGAAHSCGLAASGAAWCWGLGTNGRLGNGATAAAPTPMPVSDGYTFASLSAGGATTCGVVAASGAVRCWGAGTAGQLGTGSNGDSTVPLLVNGAGPYSAVSVGATHTCVLTTTKVAACFGRHDEGQLGVAVGQFAPTNPVGGGHVFDAVSAGTNFSCAIDTAQAAWCWGEGLAGKLGNGSTSSSTTPVAVAGGRTFASIATGATAACAIGAGTIAGQLWCWGDTHAGPASNVPVRVGAGSDWVAVSVGTVHQCARDADGGVACWGSNGSSQLGDGTTTNRAAPVASFLALTGSGSASAGVYARSQPSRILTLTRTINGSPAAPFPGNQVTAGAPLALTYTVTNAGQLPLTGVDISEPGMTLTCDEPLPADLAPLSSGAFHCTAAAPALAGGQSWTSTATATASWDDAAYSGLAAPPAPAITAATTAIAWVNGVPGLSISAAADGNPATIGAGAMVTASSTTNLVYTVTNTGDVTLTGLGLTTAPGSVTCLQSSLAPAASTTCATTAPTPAPGGTLTINPVARATWTKPDMTTVEVQATAATRLWADATPTITASAALGTPFAASPVSPGQGFPKGSNVPVQFTVTNTGPVTVTGVSITPAGATVTGLVCPPTIAPAPAPAATCTGTINNAQLPTPTQLTSAVSATWTNAGGAVRTATANAGAWLYTEPAPALTLQSKIGFVAANLTDSSPGAAIPADEVFAVLYTVTNTGDIALANVTVGSQVCAVALPIGASATCSAAFAGLAPGETFTDTATASAGWTVPATGQPGTPVTTTDAIYAWGAAAPSIAVAARIAGTAYPTPPGAAYPPGSPVAVQLTVTNTGDVDLTNLAATLGYGTISCPATVAVGLTVSCSATIAAPANGGQVTFAPSVSGRWTDPAGTVHPVNAGTTLYAWVDTNPTIGLATRIAGNDANTAPGPMVPPGTPVAMTYLVTNTSTVALAAITVSDAGVAVTCPATTLATGAAMTCTATRPAPGPGASIAATASVSGSWLAPNGITRTASASDPAHAWTDGAPALALVAAVGPDDADAVPGPRVPGGTMTLRAVVTNTGDVPVLGLAVTDSVAGTLGCPVTVLAPAASMTCTTTTAAPAPGALWSSVGTVLGAWTNAAGTARPATASDPVHAWGAAEATITLTTRLGGLGASTPPGLQVDPGAAVPVTYAVTNTSAVPLAGIGVTSADVGALTCPSAALAAGATMECTGTYAAPGGAQIARVRSTVSAAWTDPAGAAHPTTATDTAYLWTTGHAGVLVATRVNGHADTGDGVAVLPGEPAMVAVLVFNTGNVALRELTVETTPGIGLRCPSSELAVDGVMSCTAVLVGPSDGSSIALDVSVAARWLDRATGTDRQVEHADSVLVFGSPSAPDPVITLDPSRLFETRQGHSTGDGRQSGVGRLSDGQIVTVHVAGRGGVPADATAAVLNLTATGADQPGYVTVWPCGPARPLASSLNYEPGRTVANSIVARLDANGDVCMYALRATELIVDVNGYAPVDGLETVSPSRLADTRPDHATIDGAGTGTGVVAARTSIRVQVAGRGSVPADATAAVLNVIATETAGAGYLTVYPCNGAPPNASTLNYLAGTTVTNSVVAKLDAAGGVCVYTLAAAHVVVDVNGYTLASTGVAALVPARLVDTRAGNWATADGDQSGTGPVAAGTSLRVRVAGRGGVPTGVQTVLLNLSVVGAERPGYLTAYPCSSVPPSASNVNFDPTRVVANSAIVQLDEHGDVCLFGLARTDLIVDVTGFVVPR